MTTKPNQSLLESITNNELHLTTIDFTKQNISPSYTIQFLSCLCSNTTVTWLCYDRTQLRNDQLQDFNKLLQDNKILLELWLSFNHVTDIEPIKDGLVQNTTLIKLVLDGNAIGNEGAIIISHVLKLNNTLEDLHLVFCNIGDQGIKDINKSLKVNKGLMTLNLFQNDELGKDVVLEVKDVVMNVNKTLYLLFLNNYSWKRVLE